MVANSVIGSILFYVNNCYVLPRKWTSTFFFVDDAAAVAFFLSTIACELLILRLGGFSIS